MFFSKMTKETPERSYIVYLSGSIKKSHSVNNNEEMYWGEMEKTDVVALRQLNA